VVLNLVLNAAHAIGDVVEGTHHKGRIAVRTRAIGGYVEISISDTGDGIPEDVRGRIFEPFVTTKEVGRGTGQGLALSRGIVVDKLKGSLHFETETGKGTTFFIRLPVPDASDVAHSNNKQAAA
jgi:signal transduction histidine kinase